MKTIGILAFQGGIVEHEKKLKAIGVNTQKVRYPEDLAGIDGIILPGGESTCIRKLLDNFALTQPLKKKLEDGLPAWGTCAGAILLANEVDGESNSFPLGLVDICVQRNAYGSQLASFIKKVEIPEISTASMRLIFIRAPKFIRLGPEVTPLITLEDNQIVALRQKYFLVTAFHPELDEGCEFHEYFIREFITTKD